MRLTRKTNTPATTGLGISRRQFLKRTGVATGGVAAAVVRYSHGTLKARRVGCDTNLPTGSDCAWRAVCTIC